MSLVTKWLCKTITIYTRYAQMVQVKKINDERYGNLLNFYMAVNW